MKSWKQSLIALTVALMVIAVIAPVMAGEVYTRVARTWTGSVGTNVTAGMWDHWNVDKIEFTGLNPTNVTMTITVRYAVTNAYTQAVTTVTGSLAGTGSYTTDFPVTPGDALWMVPDGPSTGKCVVTYIKQSP